uniref:Uncharacterized protein n=1 Tax=Accipiter nisus TaxID=211598 RepID=A0A8B9MCC8_9AVES
APHLPPHHHTTQVTAHPEVLGVHVQLLTVEFAQLSKTFLDVVQVLHGFPEGGEHFLAMGADHGVAKDGGGAGEVPEGSKEPLGPGVDDQQPGERWRGDTSRDRHVHVSAIGVVSLHYPPQLGRTRGLLGKKD